MKVFSKQGDDRVLLMAGLLAVPGIAHAQHVPTWLALTVLSPLLVIALAIGLGFLTRSWRTAGRHAGLIVLWVILAGIFASRVENDYIIWTPMLVYALHSVLIVALVLLQLAQRIRGAVRAPGSGHGG